MCGWMMVPGLLALVPQAYANATDAAAKAAEEQLQAASAEAPAQTAPAVGTWHPKQVDGVEYLPLEDIRSLQAHDAAAQGPQGGRSAPAG